LAMEQAIDLRPGDWTYKLSRSALAVKMGDQKNYLDYSGYAWNTCLKDKNTSAELRFHTQSINEFESIANASNFSSLVQASKIDTYSELASSYYYRYRITKDDSDYQRAVFYKGKWELATGQTWNLPAK